MKAADQGRKLGVPIGVMFDCDVEGHSGAKQATWELAQQRACVRLPWFRSMEGGKFGDQGRPLATLHLDDRSGWIVGLKRLDQLLEV